LYRKKTFINRISVKYLFIGITVFLIGIYIPDLLAVQFTYSGEGDTYVFSFTKLGQTEWYQIYYVIVVFGMYVAILPALVIFNVLIIKGMNLNQYTTGENVVSKKRQLTRMIIVTNTYEILVRILLVASLILFKLDILHGIYYSPITNFLREIAYLLYGLSVTIKIFVYAYYDSNIRQKIKEHFTTKNWV
jgi:hypothetical protein